MCVLVWSGEGGDDGTRKRVSGDGFNEMGFTAANIGAVSADSPLLNLLRCDPKFHLVIFLGS